MSNISSHSPNYCASKIQATYRGYRERKFTKLLNQWVQSGPDNERDDRKNVSATIKSLHKSHHYSLYIKSKNISTLPNVFDQLTHLVEAHITKTNIQQLPDSFFKIANLEYLGLAENKLTHLPKKMNS